MSMGAIENITDTTRKGAFGPLAQEVPSLDAAIKWVALEEAGREPRWAWREPENGRLCIGRATNNDELVDPLWLMLADGREDLYGASATSNGRHLLFVVLAYEEMLQIVARFGPDARVSAAVDRNANACWLGTRLTELLVRRSEQRPRR
jgi:hypothetical protein